MRVVIFGGMAYSPGKSFRSPPVNRRWVRKTVASEIQPSEARREARVDAFSPSAIVSDPPCALGDGRLSASLRMPRYVPNANRSTSERSAAGEPMRAGSNVRAVRPQAKIPAPRANPATSSRPRARHAPPRAVGLRFAGMGVEILLEKEGRCCSVDSFFLLGASGAAGSSRLGGCLRRKRLIAVFDLQVRLIADGFHEA